MGLGGVAIAVLPYVIHPKTAVLGRAAVFSHHDQREPWENEALSL